MTKGAKIKIIGLTGPIASGKDEVCKILGKHGIHVIDVDKIGHKILFPQSAAWHEIVKLFGGRVLMRGGLINRKRLGEIVFSKPSLLKKLNKIMHPRIKKIVADEIERAKKGNFKLIVINAAVLKEIGLIPLVDEVWVVMASKAVRLKRLMKTKHYSKEQAMERIRTQADDKHYLKIADAVIRNDGTKSMLKNKTVDLLFSRQ